jgi:hypothetical protein
LTFEGRSNGGAAAWHVSKLDAPIDLQAIVLNGSQALHAITSADLRDTTTPNYALRLSSRDITLASIGHRELHQRCFMICADFK